MFYSVHHILIVNTLVHISSNRYWRYMLNNCFDGVPYAVWKQMVLRTIFHFWFCFWLIFKSKSQCPNFSCMHTLSRNSAHANTGKGTNPPPGVGRDTGSPAKPVRRVSVMIRLHPGPSLGMWVRWFRPVQSGCCESSPEANQSEREASSKLD